MCGKSNGASRPNIPADLLTEYLLNDPNKKRLWQDPNEWTQPFGPRDDPNNPGNNGDPFPPVGQPGDPGGPGNPPGGRRDPNPPTGRNDPNNPPGGTRRPPLTDPTTGGNAGRIPPSDPSAGGTTTTARNRDNYTGGLVTSGLTSTQTDNRDTYTGGVLTSGLTSTETPRDPVTRGTDVMPSGAMMNRDQTLNYLADRRPELGKALRPSFA